MINSLNNKKLGIKWLNFYINFIMPISIVSLMRFLVALTNNTNSHFYQVFATFLLIILSSITLLGL
ncbi:MAG TPA: hypothetical protein DDW50_08810 [Firmicutes bacterium]|nr:hypothetical protein [Bacillota bacterium]